MTDGKLIQSIARKMTASEWETVHNFLYLSRYVRSAREVRRTLERHFPGEDWRVLDFGCGEGQNVLILRELGMETVGLEVAPHPIWRKAGPYFKTYDGGLLPFPKDCFHAVVMFGVLEHLGKGDAYRVFQDRRLALLKIRKVLKTGGLLFIYNFPNKYAPAELLNRIFGLPGAHRGLERQGLGEVVSLIANSGYNILKAGRSGVLPAYIGRIFPFVREKIINRYPGQLDKLDKFLDRFLGRLLGQTNFVIAQKT